MSHEIDHEVDHVIDGINHYVIDKDTHFVIDPLTRSVTNALQKKTSIMQFDHNSERLSFEIDKNIEGHDMSLCNRVEIHYINKDASTSKTNDGVYEVEDYAISSTDPNKMLFTWLISENATFFAGPLTFLIMFSCVDGDSVFYRWHSGLNNSINVSNGMNNGQSIIDEYADILLQWRHELFSRNYSYEGAVENGFIGTEEEWYAHLEEYAKNTILWESKQNIIDWVSEADIDAMFAGTYSGVEDEAPGEHYVMAQSDFLQDDDTQIDFIKNRDRIAAKNDVANAIKATARGEIIRVDDVSPMEHTVKAIVCGKNIVPPFNRYYVKGDAVEQSCIEGANVIRLNGVGDSRTGGRTAFRNYVKPFKMIKGRTYTLAQELIAGSATGEPNVLYNVYITNADDGSAVTYIQSTAASKTFVAEYDCSCYIGINVVEGVTYTNADVRFWIKEGNTAGEYEPYVEPSTVSVVGCCKNLFKKVNHTQTTNGVTITSNGNGSITLTGTATDTVLLYLIKTSEKMQIPAGQYTLGLGPASLPEKVAFIIEHYDGNSWLGVIGKITRTIHENIDITERSGDLACYIKLEAGAKFSNTTLYPQLEAGVNETEYEEYRGNTFIPNDDGVINIESLSPTMTLFTDTDGVKIDLEYNRDINAALMKLIKSLVRTVSVSLPASKWTGTDGVYSQVVSIDGTTPYSKVDLQPSVEQLYIFYEKDVSFVAENDNGTITVFCIGQVPQNDYVIQATVTEVG